ncbi:MAG: hypothetical protein J0L56_14145 [Chitinophagales bacterium]|nr:hypothetical protein [Chitinophagales bacterium]
MVDIKFTDQKNYHGLRRKKTQHRLCCTGSRVVVVASGSAEDNFVHDVISSPTQTFTVSIHVSSTYQVDRIGGNAGVEIRWVVIFRTGGYSNKLHDEIGVCPSTTTNKMKHIIYKQVS